MKILIALLFAFAVSVQAQVLNVTEGQPWNLGFEMEARYGVRAYTNGVLVKTFTSAEVIPLAVANTFKVPMPALPSGIFNVTLVAFDGSTNSAPSAPLVLPVTQIFVITPPKNLKPVP